MYLSIFYSVKKSLSYIFITPFCLKIISMLTNVERQKLETANWAVSYYFYDCNTQPGKSLLWKTLNNLTTL